MEQNKCINRRDFIKATGAAALATTAALHGCSQQDGSRALDSVPTDKMTYRLFPSLGDNISLLGYGCMRFPFMPNPAGPGEIPDQETINELIDYAIAHGVNFFDTAPGYMRGLSEEATGIALSRHPRDKYFISTKLSNPGNHDFNFGVEMYETSFRRLQVDYIDYYFLHNIGTIGSRGFVPRFIDNGLLDFLLKERESGRIRKLGWSFHGVAEGFDQALALHEQVHWDFVMIQMNYSDWRFATGNNVNADYLYAELVKRNIPTIIMEPLLGGRLAHLPTHIVSRLKEQNPDDSVASWAFRYAGSYDNIFTILSGMTYMEHLQDNIRTFSPLAPLDDEQKEFLHETAELMQQYPIVPCTYCMYCMPCPYGIDIPGVLQYYNNCINDGNLPRGSNDADYSRARRAFLIGYDRNVEKVRQASHCIGCKQCVEHCPQRLNIPDFLHNIDGLVEQLKQDTL